MEGLEGKATMEVLGGEGYVARKGLSRMLALSSIPFLLLGARC